MKSTTRKIKEAFENATPNVLGSILTDCGAKDSQPLSVVPTKKPSRFLNFAASAAALLLLAGIGAGIASLVIAGRTQYATTQTEETTAPTTDEDLKQLNNDIIRAFCELTDNDYTKIGSKLSVRHYWNADGSYIFFVDGLQDYPNEITYFSLLSKEFLFPTTQIFYTYKDGYCYEAEHSLYQTAFISHEQFLEFYEYHKLQNADLYDPTNWPARSALDCPAHLTSEKRAELEKALGIDTYYDTDRFWDSYRYYGTYEGYDILLQEHKELFGTHITDIAGQAFACPYWYTIFAHKDGIQIDLNEAYKQGLISKESIKAAYAWNYQDYGESSAVCCPHPTYIYIQKRIEEAWQKISDEPFGTWYSEDNPDGDWRFYSADILFYCGGEQEAQFTSIKIGDSFFAHPTTFQLYYFDHETLAFIPLDEAYGEIVTKDSVADAASLHAQCQEFAFGEDWLANQNHNFENTVLRKPTCSDPGEGINVCTDCGYRVSCEYECKPHTYECLALEFATCQQTGMDRYTCRDCGYSYTVEVPKFDHYWLSTGCSTPGKCLRCGIYSADPIHPNKTYSRTESPTEDRAGIDGFTCGVCRRWIYKVYGNTGEYGLRAIELEIIAYVEQLGFTYKEDFPRVPYQKYEYAESYKVLESLGGHDVLREKAYELVDKLYADACNSLEAGPYAYDLWFTIEYNYNTGIFKISTFIAS